jgi:hypothetical protein
MKKMIAMFSLAALLLTATTVFAQGDEEKSFKTDLKAEFKGEAELKGKRGIVSKLLDRAAHNDRFVILGSVVSTGTTSLVVDVQRDNHPREISGNVTIAVSADTKMEGTLADLKAGQKVLIKGQVKDSGLVALSIRAVGEDEVKPKLHKSVAVGSVTAKTDTSVTLKNSITGTEKTVTVDPDTKVVINGEVATAADIQVGDKGIVKFKVMVDTVVAKIIRLFR